MPVHTASRVADRRPHTAKIEFVMPDRELVDPVTDFLLIHRATSCSGVRLLMRAGEYATYGAPKASLVAKS
jgi:hypothetical protein